MRASGHAPERRAGRRRRRPSRREASTTRRGGVRSGSSRPQGCRSGRWPHGPSGPSFGTTWSLWATERDARQLTGSCDERVALEAVVVRELDRAVQLEHDPAALAVGEESDADALGARRLGGHAREHAHERMPRAASEPSAQSPSSTPSSVGSTSSRPSAASPSRSCVTASCGDSRRKVIPGGAASTSARFVSVARWVTIASCTDPSCQPTEPPARASTACSPDLHRNGTHPTVSLRSRA